MRSPDHLPVLEVEAEGYSVPTDGPESDGTLTWDSTGLVVVRVRAGDEAGLGYAYTSPAAAMIVRDTLAPTVKGGDAMAPRAAWHRMWHEIRNLGRPGVVSSAMAAVDVALWDLKARLLEVPLVDLLGALRPGIPAYGSGGFTSYSLERLRTQLAGWAEAGLPAVKMKVGRDPEADPERVATARDAIGDDAELFVDANGAYDRKQALAWTRRFHEQWGVTWMEEPVSSDDVAGLHEIRDHGPAGVHIAAGEYGWDLFDFRALLEGGAVDVLQADLGRCGGYTPFMRVGALCEAHNIPLSSHTSPALHTPVMCAVHRGIHAEYFRDHVRIEALLFDGAPRPEDGILSPRRDHRGHGLTFKRSDSEDYRVT